MKKVDFNISFKKRIDYDRIKVYAASCVEIPQWR